MTDVKDIPTAFGSGPNALKSTAFQGQRARPAAATSPRSPGFAFVRLNERAMSEAEEGASLKFKCGNCGARFRVSERDRGKNVRCPECGKALRVPARSAPVRGTPPRGVPTPPAGQATTPDPTSSDQLMVDAVFRQMARLKGRAMSEAEGSATLKLKCGGCGTKSRVSQRDRGKNVRCPECGKALRVPATPPTGSHGAGAPCSPDDVVGQLERLGKLRQQGILTEQEFLAQKSRILETPPGAPYGLTPEGGTPSDALVECQECGNRVSGELESCPFCGAPVPEEVFWGPAKTGETLGIPMLIAPVAASMGCWFWIGSMNLLQMPGSKLVGLAVLTIVGTGALAAIEADRLGVGSPEDTTESGVRRSGPIAWFLFITLLWVIGYPAYLYYRSRYGLRNLLVGGVLVALAFLGSFGVMGMAIESKKAEVRQGLANIGSGFSDATQDLSVPSRTARPPIFTRAEYDRISEGMSYRQLVLIIGTEGTEFSSRYTPGISGVTESISTKMYSWENEDGSNMSAIFQNDRLTSKSQFGLK